jgi:hypothetical protein
VSSLTQTFSQLGTTLADPVCKKNPYYPLTHQNPRPTRPSLGFYKSREEENSGKPESDTSVITQQK